MSENPVQELFTRQKKRVEIVFTFLFFLIAYLFLNYLTAKNPQDVYALIYSPFLYFAGLLFVISIALPQFPVKSLSLGDPSKKVGGIPLVLVAGLIGFLIFFFPTLIGFKSLQAVASEEDFLKVSLGSGIVEELFGSAILVPTLANILLYFGLALGSIVFMFFSFFFIPLQWIWIFVLIAFIFIIVGGQVKMLNETQKIWASFLIALLLYSLFFSLLHMRVRGGEMQTDDMKFAFATNLCNVATGGFACSLSAHVTNNSIVGGNNIIPAIIILILLVLYVVAFKKLGGK